ncbi:hypothetical protein ENSA5_19720 [Enhygromyxa salina]|uniref:Lipoprotein n=1 Tax=Enhygromyxa salina TaxID=215803 RepID=A0A2S9YD57_9BACT|nr:hypothetical protein [Enhygromyxa salina]PRQ03033.1 hypothetical protein ENSA5_19720 [Enhygromyxa salina]
MPPVRARSRFASVCALVFVALLSFGGPGCSGGCVGGSGQGLTRTTPDVRAWYNAQVSTIPDQNQIWLLEGLSAEERAHRAYTIRHEARLEARAMMSSKLEVAQLRARDRAKYGDPDGPSFEYLVEKNRQQGLEGDAIYEAIIESAARTNEKVNARFRDKQ